MLRFIYFKKCTLVAQTLPTGEFEGYIAMMPEITPTSPNSPAICNNDCPPITLSAIILFRANRYFFINH